MSLKRPTLTSALCSGFEASAAGCFVREPSGGWARGASETTPPAWGRAEHVREAGTAATDCGRGRCRCSSVDAGAASKISRCRLASLIASSLTSSAVIVVPFSTTTTMVFFPTERRPLRLGPTRGATGHRSGGGSSTSCAALASSRKTLSRKHSAYRPSSGAQDSARGESRRRFPNQVVRRDGELSDNFITSSGASYFAKRS